MKRIVILGATGSIGTQTIDVIQHHLDAFCVVGISVGYNITKLKALLSILPDVHTVCVASQVDAHALEAQYPQLRIVYGDAGLVALAQLDSYDLLVHAIVGFRGLAPLLCAIANHKSVALANKESLVAGGMLVKKALQTYDVDMLPIDSEHSAIFQCLQGNERKSVEKLIVTASGGSLRDLKRDQLDDVTVERALAHPNWQMGKRITIDSATMMNKGFEILEAHFLFDVPYENIEVFIHRESIVHSMVQYCDHSIIAQLGSADMRLPIQYALSYPSRLPLFDDGAFDFTKHAAMHFEAVDTKRYPLVALAYEVGRRGGNLGAIMNGADEEAVELFLKERISFLDIETCIKEAIKQVGYIKEPTLHDLITTDQKSRAFVHDLVNKGGLVA